ncbi:hypothetical protein PFISCL1PPCAC_15196, partial [Pristionchus fissidentatus]
LQMVVVDNQPARLWVGPLILILVVTLIYIFSVLPQTRPTVGMDALPSHPSYGKSERVIPTFRMESDSYLDVECGGHGRWNEMNKSCACLPHYRGDRCLEPLCMNGGMLNNGRCRCSLGFAGEFCEFRCIGGMGSEERNDTIFCLCHGQKFGLRCEYLCVHGTVVDGDCKCNQGFEGQTCELCSPSSSLCPPPSSSLRRSSINSRLTLSGLSFCLITIGLLCVTASRRHRLSSSSPWFSLRDPRSHLSCPSSLRISSRSSRSPHIRPPPLTPPPIYRSLENLPQGIAPPSYEEATAPLPSTAINIEDESPSDDDVDDKTTQ